MTFASFASQLPPIAPYNGEFVALETFLPPCDVQLLAPFVHQIIELKQQHNFAILAGRSIGVDIARTVADVHGGHATLLHAAQHLPQQILLVCESRAVAESIAVLCPHKNIVVVDDGVIRPERESVHPSDVEALRQKYPQAALYVEPTTSPEVKALADAVVPDAYMLQAVQNTAAEQVIVLPDRNLARYVALHSQKTIIGWQGVAGVRERFTGEMVVQARQHYPTAWVVAHPACRADVLAAADVAAFPGDALRLPADGERPVIIFDDSATIEDLHLTAPQQVILPHVRHRCHHSARISLLVLHQACLTRTPLQLDDALRERLQASHAGLQAVAEPVATPRAPRTARSRSTGRTA